MRKNCTTTKKIFKDSRKGRPNPTGNTCQEQLKFDMIFLNIRGENTILILLVASIVLIPALAA